MPELYGKTYSREQLLRRTGNSAQVAGLRQYTYSSGRADGVQAVELKTGRMTCEILPGRCLDIAALSYRGFPVGYHSKSGLRHPAYFAKRDADGFHDSFLGGVLTTCGLHNIGPATEVDGRSHPLHGGIANMPADRVSVAETWDGEDCVFSVSGEIRHSSFYHEDLVLRRSITSRLGAACLTLEDEVENMDFVPAACLVLYHIQFGFPFLGEASRLLTSPILRSSARSGTPEHELRRFAAFGPPEDGVEESCFYHHFQPNAGGWAAACLFNPELGELGMGAYVRYHTGTLPYFVQWKMLRSREYVCGLEPSTAPLDADERTPSILAANTLGPLEKRRYRLEVGVIEGEETFHKLAQREKNDA